MRLAFHLHNGKLVNNYGAKVEEVPFSEMDFANQKIIKTRRKKLLKKVDLTQIDGSQFMKKRHVKRETTPSCDHNHDESLTYESPFKIY